MSRRPGIGSNYLATHTKWHRADMRNYTQVNGILGRLPRFYKDKMFNQFEKRRMSNEGLEKGDTEYLKAIEKLSRYHADPYAYFEERVAYTHDGITSKVNTQNLF